MSTTNLPASDFIASLQKSFQEGSLEFLVGAGASIASGLPTWNELNRRLLSTFLAQEHSDLEFQSRDLDVAAQIFVDNFGREAVVDVVRNKLKSDGRYLDMLRGALYLNGSKDVSSIHLELAAILAASKSTSSRRLNGLYTFNFDDLLERAAERLLGKVPEVIVAGERSAEPHVVHLHGYLPPPTSGKAPSGTVVLSEKDYHEARGDWASRKLDDLFTDEKKTVLMVGLSLADPRLRGLLLERVKLAQRNKPVAHVYALLSNSPPSPDAELMERLARNFVRRHQEDFWASWQMHVLNIESHELVPFYLRQIRLGSNGGTWAEKGEAFLRNNSPIFKDLYREDVQRKALSVLEGMHSFLKRRFAVAQEEEIHIGGFVPAAGAVIQLGFRYRGGKDTDDIVTESYAQSRRLSVASLEQAQGVSGRAFLRGVTLEASSSPRLHDNFTEPMLETWTNDQLFSSMLCVPIYDSVDWVPIGVIYLTSNRPSPFWAELDSSQDYDTLETLLRNTFTEVLRYAPI
ncbi:SIR2 family protein [Cystobacter fuscus]|uniref:SIR2 family protein n=1 Tax=Cystobacter fuscus TaxID=43 RepID=UPI002B2B51A3|nr:hypothetical protein F0U63_46115 [Cystobacter fuscus]